MVSRPCVPSKYYTGGSVFYESAIEILKFCLCFFFSRAVAISPPSTQQLCPVDAKMQNVLLACTYLQMQASTCAAMLKSTPSDANRDGNNSRQWKRTGILEGKIQKGKVYIFFFFRKYTGVLFKFW